jgi:hypothetical protein
MTLSVETFNPPSVHFNFQRSITHCREKYCNILKKLQLTEQIIITLSSIINMKIPLTLTVLLSAIIFSSASAQQTFKNQPLLHSDSSRADIRIENQWYLNRWRISPQIPHDTLKVKIYPSKEHIAFRTDQDSISFLIRQGESKEFYVQMGKAEPAHTIITAQAYPWDNISYTAKEKRKDVNFYYEKSENTYFDELRSQYPITEVFKNDNSDKERVLSIMNWVHYRWKHNGGNSPKGNDGISILNEAKAGGRFPCFAYAIVLRDQLTASGFTARVLYLKFKDAEKSDGAPGHVVAEVYLKDQKKWAFIDGQFNVMATMKGKPLNAVEFQKALSTNYDQVVLASRDVVSKKEYTEFVYDYLFYLNTALDNRLIPAKDKFTVDGKTDLMLVPNGASNLTKMKFFDTKINNCIYTNNSVDFYPQPK